MLDTLGENTESENLGLSLGFLRRTAVGHDARELGHLGQPTAVLLALALDAVLQAAPNVEARFILGSRRSECRTFEPSCECRRGAWPAGPMT